MTRLHFVESAVVAKRRFSMFRRGEDERHEASNEQLGDSRNGISDEGRKADPPTSLFDRATEADEFGALAGERDREKDGGEEVELRPLTDEWQIGDSAGPPTAEADAFGPPGLPLAEPPSDEDVEPAHEQPAPEPVSETTQDPAAVEERIWVAELAASEAAERRLMEEIVALEEDLERARREGVAKANALEAKLAEAERRASEAEEARDAAEQARTEAQERTSVEVEAARQAVEERYVADLRKRDEELSKVTARVRESTEEKLAEDAVEVSLEATAAAAAEFRGRGNELEAARAESEPEKAPAAEAPPPAWVIDVSDEEKQPEPAPAAATKRSAEEPAPKQPVAEAGTPEGALRLSTASFDELRELGMSVTQAKRVIRQREEGGFQTVDELERVPGFPKAFLAEVRDRLVP
jgi:hypothetical protein